ncbi:DUF5694 domain-containing protein [Sporosarcina gallistercoris]|uniref:Haem-binding uptake Tiki superfamily ChaN domain-containing protein n=1 Tax=Sporosarcina gallistercoris TaxID=2762245 RepID=A0ABR8PN97_9BACL|nr:DUF5694 domain-containing protein [Sporosarcina gallistercoris]MBD7909662.1 hypothetical protein [Sporosarcina gallistercoris]
MKQDKAKILILGTFHMSEYEELHSEKRQTEIQELVLKIARFQPTKIAVEMVPKDSGYFNEKYDQYKSGSQNLEMNEIFQVAFRLDVEMGHEQIYPTDWMGDADMHYSEVESWGRENQPELLKEIYEDLFIPELTDSKSIVDYYKELNDPVFINAIHKMYVNLARLGDFDNYIGMNWLSWWYKRNLIMFSNLTRLIESEEERILFLVGSSHSSIVTKFLEESEVCEVVQPLRVLS